MKTSHISSRLGINDLLNPSKHQESEYVLIDADRNGGNRAGSFNIAYEGGFLTHQGNGIYKCKRIVAKNLDLVVFADCPLIMK